MVKLSSIEAMLERQAKLSEVRSRMAREGEDVAPQQGPWITISRQLGAGGSDLGRRLADELDWTLYDSEIVSKIAKHTHTRETVVSWLDAKMLGPVMDYLARLMDSEIPGQLPYVQEMVRVIWGLARQGNAIILGRGANWFLDSRYGLRLRITAPFDERVARVSHGEGIDRTAAEKRVETHDAQRQRFIRGVFGQGIDDPAGYDCVINTASLGADTAAAVVLTALRQKLKVDV